LAGLFLLALAPSASRCSPARGVPDGASAGEDPFAHWELVQHDNFGGRVPVAKYHSRRSDLRVTIAKLDTPIVEVYMCVPTEVWNDDGAPHVLEHLLFQKR